VKREIGPDSPTAVSDPTRVDAVSFKKGDVFSQEGRHVGTHVPIPVDMAREPVAHDLLVFSPRVGQPLWDRIQLTVEVQR